MANFRSYLTRLDEFVAKSLVGRYFRLDGSGHPKTRLRSKLHTEFLAGLTTFFAMAYIISVNATILSDSGGNCICTDPVDPTCATDVNYSVCLAEIRRDFITGTAAISALTTFCMGLFANMPIALAPGMGLNAYFTYTVVGFHGTGPVAYNLALTAVFVEGFIFVALSLCGLRQWFARIIPNSIKLASGVGIGLYLTLIGMTYSAGIGVVTGAQSTPLELAGCRQDQLVDGICPAGSKMRAGTMWIGIFIGGFLTAILLAFRIKGAIMIGIIATSVISWPRDTELTYFPHTTLGDNNFEFFKKVVTFHPITRTLGVQQWNLNNASGQFVLALVTFLYVDILDCTGTLYAMARFAGAYDKKTGDFEGSAVAYLIDALGISIGSLMGLSPVTAFVESGAGIAAGGKTGITAMSTGLCFFISIFFAPIFASIPPWATGSTLILVGAMMAVSVKDINWRYLGDSLPAFLTLAVMPFTYSIAYGLIAGILSYTILNTGIWLVMLVSRDQFQPKDIAHKEVWTWNPPGGIAPPWIRRIAKRQKDFWHEETLVISQPGGYEVEMKERSKDQTTTSDDDTPSTPSTPGFLGSGSSNQGSSSNPTHIPIVITGEKSS